MASFVHSQLNFQKGPFRWSSGKLSCCLSPVSIWPVSASSIAINPRTVYKVKWFKWLPHLWFILLFTLIQAEEWKNIPNATIETIYFELSVKLLFILAPVWHSKPSERRFRTGWDMRLTVFLERWVFIVAWLKEKKYLSSPLYMCISEKKWRVFIFGLPPSQSLTWTVMYYNILCLRSWCKRVTAEEDRMYSPTDNYCYILYMCTGTHAYKSKDGFFFLEIVFTPFKKSVEILHKTTKWENER